jgi:hypothetical protein
MTDEQNERRRTNQGAKLADGTMVAANFDHLEVEENPHRMTLGEVAEFTALPNRVEGPREDVVDQTLQRTYVFGEAPSDREWVKGEVVHMTRRQSLRAAIRLFIARRDTPRAFLQRKRFLDSNSIDG